ncbi:MAG: hypothetical protein JXQ87_04890 [Bacteroidia bacterium]
MFNTIEPNHFQQIRKGNDYVFVDIRSRNEFSNDGLAGSIHIPYYDLPDRLTELPIEKNIVFICNDGKMAGAARNFVKGFACINSTFALSEGINEVHKLLERKKAG